MRDYVLISFYNRGTIFQPIWEVYGHKSFSENDHLITMPTRSTAIEYAHSVAVRTPVIEGSSWDCLAGLLNRGEVK